MCTSAPVITRFILYKLSLFLSLVLSPDFIFSLRRPASLLLLWIPALCYKSLSPHFRDKQASCSLWCMLCMHVYAFMISFPSFHDLCVNKPQPALSLCLCVFEMVNTFLEFVCPWPTKRQANCLSSKRWKLRMKMRIAELYFFSKLVSGVIPLSVSTAPLIQRCSHFCYHSDWFCTITTHLLHVYLFVRML